MASVAHLRSLVLACSACAGAQMHDHMHDAKGVSATWMVGLWPLPKMTDGHVRLMHMGMSD